MDMKVNIAGVEWKNPVTVASGTVGTFVVFFFFVCVSVPSWCGNDQGRCNFPVGL